MTAPTDVGRRPWTLVAAAIVVVVTVGLVLILGVVRPPALAHVSDDPAVEVPGRAAWTAWQRSTSCLHMVQLDGTVEELRCGDQPRGEVRGWEDGAIVLVVDLHGPDGGEELLVDPETGETRSSRPAPAGAERHLAGPTEVPFRTERTGGDLVVHVDGVVVWRTPALEAYEVREAQLSADGGTVLLQDTADRLLLVPADGSAPPRVWATDVSSWTSLAWEAAATS